MILPVHLHGIALQGIAEALATGILVCIAGGVPIAFFAWAALRISRRQSAGANFAVLYSALIAIGLLPLAEGLRLGAVYSANGQPSHSLLTISSSWAVLVFALWTALASIALVRVITGIVRLRGLRQSCRRINFADLDPILQQALGELRCERGVELRISDELSVPTAIGFFKPLVILPAWALQDLSASQLRPVLLHELAHVRRWDDWTNLLQKVIQAVLFFHPAVWWIERRISLEREMACDDMVLAHTGNPRAYAQSLLSVAEKSFVRRRGFSLAQAAVSRMRQTSARITQILDGNRRRTMRAWKPATMLVAASFLLGFVVLPRVSNLVAFRDDAPIGAAGFKVKTKTPEQPIQIATSTANNARLPRPEFRMVSFKTKHSASPALSEDRNIISPSLVEAKFPTNETYGSPSPGRNAATNSGVFITQTVLVVRQFQGDSQSPEFWTIHVWQLTVFEPPTTTQNNLPAKKV